LRNEEVRDLRVPPLRLVVRSDAHDRREASFDDVAVARGAVDVGREDDPVPHLHHHVLADGDPVAHEPSFSTIRLPVPSTETVKPGWTTVVESNSSMTTGPVRRAPAGSA